MLEALIRWSLRQRLLVLALALCVSGVGAFVGLSLPIDLLPDLTAPTVTVLVEGGTLAPRELEQQVSFPIEAAMNGASGVRRVRSATALGIAVVWVEFDWDTSVAAARQSVAERLGLLRGSLPDSVAPPRIAPVSSMLGEVLFLGLVSDRHDAMALRRTANVAVRRRLLALPGVSQVTPTGGEVQQYQVVLELERLRAEGVAAAEVLSALADNNRDLSAGVLELGSRELIVEGLGRVRTLADLAQIRVAERAGRPIAIADLGSVRLGPAPRRGSGSVSRRGADGQIRQQPAVILAVQKQPGANTLELTARLEREVRAIQAGLPAGMELCADLFRQADFIEASVHNTAAALLEGAGIVVLIVLAFLASLRASLITLAALPISVLCALLALSAFGAEINTMTLGGMAIAIGALVDDAIIDVENVVRRLRENARAPAGERRPVGRVVLAASLEVRGSILLATLIILLAFVPLFALDGIEGRLLEPLGIAFAVSLAASLIVALTLTPALCVWLLPGSASVRQGREPALIRALARAYRPLLRWSLRHPRSLQAGGWLLLLGALPAALGLGQSFLPPFDEGALVVSVTTLPGTSLAQSEALAQRVERQLLLGPEVVSIARRTGRAEEDEHVQGVEASELEVRLDMRAPLAAGRPQRSRAELLAALRENAAEVPGVALAFGQPIGHRIDHILSGTRAALAVKVQGPDLEELRRLGLEVERLLRGVPGLVDLSREQQSEVDSLRVEFERGELARHGLSIEAAALALELGTRGRRAGQVLEGIEAYDLVLRTGAAPAESREQLQALPVETPTGARLPLAAVATIRADRTPNFITRENVQRKQVVMGNLAGGDSGRVVAEVQRRLDAGLSLPPGYSVELGGQFQSARATQRRLAWIGTLVVVAIAVLLQASLRSWRDVALVLAGLPMALVGGVGGVWLSGGVLSVASLIGFICVFGVAARSGIMLVAHIRQLEREGIRDLAAAVEQGALERLAPILMTNLAAGLALVPIALRAGEPGNEILAPMALVILCGLGSATLLSLALLPSLFLRFARPAPAQSPEALDGLD